MRTDTRGAIQLAFALLGAVFVSSPQASAESESDAGREISAQIHRDAIVIDGHNDVAIWILDFGFDLGMDGSEPDDRWILGENVLRALLEAEQIAAPSPITR